MKKVIRCNEAPAAIGAYSQAIEIGNLVFCSGQIPLQIDTNAPMPTEVATQAEQVMKNIGAILKTAGLSYANIVKSTIFLTDMGNFQTVNEVYAKHFPEQPPARSTIGVAALPRGAKVEIEVIAARG